MNDAGPETIAGETIAADAQALGVAVAERALDVENSLSLARRLAQKHMFELVEIGFSHESAEHVASGALYDIQTVLLRALNDD